MERELVGFEERARIGVLGVVTIEVAMVVQRKLGLGFFRVDEDDSIFSEANEAAATLHRINGWDCIKAYVSLPVTHMLTSAGLM